MFCPLFITQDEERKLRRKAYKIIYGVLFSVKILLLFFPQIFLDRPVLMADKNGLNCIFWGVFGSANATRNIPSPGFIGEGGRDKACPQIHVRNVSKNPQMFSIFSGHLGEKFCTIPQAEIEKH